MISVGLSGDVSDDKLKRIGHSLTVGEGLPTYGDGNFLSLQPTPEQRGELVGSIGSVSLYDQAISLIANLIASLGLGQ